jgi:hypothetical protein
VRSTISVPSQLAAGGQRGVDAGDAAGGGVQVGRGDLGQAPPGRVDDAVPGQVGGVEVRAVLHRRACAEPGRQVRPDERGDPGVLGGGQAGLVGQQLPQGDLVLPRGGELRPVRGDRGVEVEAAQPGQPGRARRDQALADREGVDQGVLLPGTAGILVGPAAPEVGDYAAVDEEGEGCSSLTPFVKIRSKAARTDVKCGSQVPVVFSWPRSSASPVPQLAPFLS